MILCIDAGNSRTAIGAVDGEKLLFTAHMSTDLSKTPDEYAVSIRQMFRLNGAELSDIEGGIISSVVPVISPVLREALEKLMGKPPLMVGAGLKTGLNILIDDPGQLGSDLVCDAVAALKYYPQRPTLVLGLGTATTLSVINEKGAYIGGMLIAGAMLAANALAGGASLLTSVSPEPPAKIIATNTVDCMKSGLIYGNAAMLDGIIERVEESLGQKACVVATGGMAKFIIPHCRREILHDEWLTLKGLALIYTRNVKPAGSSGAERL